MDIITTWMIVIIACVAVYISIWQVRTTQRHNKLSVKPHLNIDTSASKGINIINAGAGPAIIESFSCSINGKEFPNSLRGEDYRSIQEEFGVTQKIFHWRWFKIGDYLLVNDKVWLIEVFEDEKKLTNKDINSLRVAFDRVKIKIKYKSIYGDCDVAKYNC